MRSGTTFLPAVILGMTVSAYAQLSQDARISIISTLSATEGAARIQMPLGKGGVELSSDGSISREKLQKEIANNGISILPGRVVTITKIEFNSKSIEFELDGGGSKKGSFLSRVQVSVGVSSQTQGAPAPQVHGSKVTLLFPEKLPKDLTGEQVKSLLSPVLDFTRQSLIRTGIEALPPEFQEAVRAKEARIGMDSNTVLLALGQPDNRHREKNNKGVEQEDWIYEGRGRRKTFVTFENGVVVDIRQY